ncbi:hypothetical protein R4Y45_07340 [Holzapfeliella sp. He02]|uniref:DUF4352 domain-containing protein n=1 Tax=Holzapfeliella saturejae TaxID=3082953 RepID=A0ABU8SI14_9LACO
MKKSLILPLLALSAVGLSGCSKNDTSSGQSSSANQNVVSSESTSSTQLIKDKNTAEGFNKEITIDNVTYSIIKAKVEPLSMYQYPAGEIYAPNVVTVTYNVKNNSNKSVDVGNFANIGMYGPQNKRLKPFTFSGNIDQTILNPGTQIDANISYATDNAGDFKIGFTSRDTSSFTSQKQVDEGYAAFKFNVSQITEN